MNGRLSTQNRSMAEGDDCTREGLELIQVDIHCYGQVTILLGLYIVIYNRYWHWKWFRYLLGFFSVMIISAI